jgi:hypothetical protein
MKMRFLVPRNLGITLAVIGACVLTLLERKAAIGLALALGLTAGAQPSSDQPELPGAPPPGGDFPPPGFDGPPPFGPGGFGPGAMRETKLVGRFDKEGKGWLNTAERKAAREYLHDHPNTGRGMRRGPGGGRPPWGRGGDEAPVGPGPKVSPAEVASLSGQPLYASNVVRTLFLEFVDSDWEKEMAEFKPTDVEVPAKLTVDGQVYADVGVHFHGMSSFMMVSDGHKRSLVLSLDMAHSDQTLEGYRKLNLLNSHEDPSFLRTVLAMQIARDIMPAPKANFMRVVINGESWGIYVNQEHFNKEFTKEQFGSTKGARWKVPGSPRGQGGLEYLGEDIESYRRIYEIKSKDNPKSWAALIQLCKTLQETQTEQLEKNLAPTLDLDGVLKFLAWEDVLANADGFYTRASDYDLYLDEKGRFHVIPYDANETFSLGEGPGGPGGPRGPGRIRGPRGPSGGGVKLDPLGSAEDDSKPLLAKLLAVPALRERYLSYVRDLATRWLDWNRLSPVAEQYHELIAKDVAADTRKLYPEEAFVKSVDGEIKKFADERREFLLNRRKE